MLLGEGVDPLYASFSSFPKFCPSVTKTKRCKVSNICFILTLRLKISQRQRKTGETTEFLFLIAKRFDKRRADKRLGTERRNFEPYHECIFLIIAPSSLLLVHFITNRGLQECFISTISCYLNECLDT